MMRLPLYPIAVLLVFSCFLPAEEARTIEHDQRKAWNSRKAYFDDNYVIVTRSGATIMALAPYEVKGDRAVFRILINYREGPLTSLPLSEIDLAATKKANERPAATPTAKLPSHGQSHPSGHSSLPDVTGHSGQSDWGHEPLPPPPPPAAKHGGQLSDAEQRLVGLRRIQRGMSRAALLASWGSPDKKEELELTGGEAWLYLVAGETPYQVTVANGKVMLIQQGERLVFVASLPKS